MSRQVPISSDQLEVIRDALKALAAQVAGLLAQARSEEGRQVPEGEPAARPGRIR
jgi:hypothetical protein